MLLGQTNNQKRSLFAGLHHSSEGTESENQGIRTLLSWQTFPSHRLNGRRNLRLDAILSNVGSSPISESNRCYAGLPICFTRSRTWKYPRVLSH